MGMAEGIIADLKQFISGHLRLEFSGVNQRLDKIETDLSEFKQEMSEFQSETNRRFDEVDQQFDATREAITNSNDSTDEQLKDHERRISALESSAA